MTALLLMGLGWIVGLSGVTVAATLAFLESWGHSSRGTRGTRWALLWIVLLPACEVQCEIRRGSPGERDAVARGGCSSSSQGGGTGTRADGGRARAYQRGTGVVPG